MRMTWARRKASPAAAVDRMHFVMWDFLKMLLAAIVCGIAVSFAAAAIALVLSHNAHAQPSTDVAGSGHYLPTVHSSTDSQTYPGVMLIGSGCDADMLEAFERDWKVTINGKYIDVRVMQTFIMQAGEATTATFNASLPPRARLLRFNVHTNGSLWQGKVVDANAYGQLSAVDFRQLARRSMLIVQYDEGVISTDAIINIAATEAVTIEYTYRTANDATSAPQNLFVVLANEATSINQVAGTRTPHATVWVEWIGNYPTHLNRMPGGAFLETANSKISGLSWTNGQRDGDTRFHLAWSM